MSCVVRFWTTEELDKVREGDPWLFTLLVNKRTWNLAEWEAMTQSILFPSLKTFEVVDGDPDVENVTIKAPDADMLWKFIDIDFLFPSDPEVFEVVTTHTPIVRNK